MNMICNDEHIKDCKEVVNLLESDITRLIIGTLRESELHEYPQAEMNRIIDKGRAIVTEKLKALEKLKIVIIRTDESARNFIRLDEAKLERYNNTITYLSNLKEKKI